MEWEKQKNRSFPKYFQKGLAIIGEFVYNIGVFLVERSGFRLKRSTEGRSHTTQTNRGGQSS